MPRGDRTGPLGNGPMTGRGAGPCGGQTAQGLGRRGQGLGAGAGRGGWGLCNRFFSRGLGAWFGFGRGVGVQSDPDQEKQVLKQQSELMQQELDAVKKRLEEIEGPAK